MMETVAAAEIIARIVGPVYVFVALGLLINPGQYGTVTQGFLEHRAVCYLAGILTLATGAAILSVHYAIKADWTIIITILGWLALVKGALLTSVPDRLLRFWLPLMRRPPFMRLTGIGALLFGVYLAGKGYGVL